MGLLDVFDLTAVWARLRRFLGPVGKLVDSGIEAARRLTTIVQRASKLLDDSVAEFKAWRHFKEDIKFRSRVVNLEIAFTKTRDLIEGIPKAWRSILDLWKQFRGQVGAELESAEAVDLATEAEEGSGEGLTALLEKFPKLAKALEKVLGVLALVLQALDTLSRVIDDLADVLAEITRLRLEIEKLDTIFLSQSNKRQRVKLADGKSIRIRVGKLHSAGV